MDCLPLHIEERLTALEERSTGLDPTHAVDDDHSMELRLADLEAELRRNRALIMRLRTASLNRPNTRGELHISMFYVQW